MNQAAKNGGFVTRTDLTYVPVPSGEPRRVIDASRGIWNPRDMDATLSVVSSPGAYPDREVEGGLYHYSYRAGSINGDNAKLRRAYELRVPIILLRKVRDGVFVPHAPVYVVGDLQDRREFLLALDENARFLASEFEATPQRSYVERLVRQRLHQADFRGRVIAAYETRCAVCRLRHGQLLDAAHITPDNAEEGLPYVSNGLSLCKIHHAAFDSDSAWHLSAVRDPDRASPPRRGRRAHASARSSGDARCQADRPESENGQARPRSPRGALLEVPAARILIA